MGTGQGVDPKDLRVDVYRAGVNNPCYVRITHVPTGLTREATHRSQLRAREQAMRLLRAALDEERP